MSARTIPDGAGVTNHFTVSFAPHVVEAGATSVGGLGDSTEIIDGPDGRGYSTGKGTRRDLTVVIPTHDPASPLFHAWRLAVENGAPGSKVPGSIVVADAGENPVAIYELDDCQCYQFEPNDLQMDGAEVAQETFTISYSRMRRVGP